MKKRSKQLAALFLSVVMAMTSVDGTAFVMASDSTETAGETGWEHDQGQAAESSSETEIVTEAVSEESEPDSGGQEEETLVASYAMEEEEEQILGCEDFPEETVFSFPKNEAPPMTLNDGSEIASVSVTKEKKTIAAYGVPDNLAVGTEYVITYKNGATDDGIKDSGSDAYDGWGNEITFWLENQENKAQSTKFVNPEKGTYALVIKCQGEEVGRTGYIYRCLEMEEVCQDRELIVGTNQVEGTYDGDGRSWYRFTAPESGTYKVDKCGDLVVYQKKETGWTKGTVTGKTFRTTANEVYYIGFSGVVYDDDDNELEQWEMELSLLPEITDIKISSLKRRDYMSGLDSYIGYDSEVTVTYAGGKEDDTFLLDYATSYTDRYGNAISVGLKKVGDDTIYSITDAVPIGTYDVVFTIAGKTFTSTGCFRILAAVEANLPTLTAGKDCTIKSGDDYEPNWYQFTAPESGTYVLDQAADVEIVHFSEEGVDRTTLEAWEIVKKWTVQKGETYYLGFTGCLETEEGDEIDTWTAKLFKTLAVSKIEVTPGRTEFWAKYWQKVVDYTELTFTYEDGTTKKFEQFTDEGDTDEFGNSISYVITAKDPADTEEYSNWDSLNPGTYVVHVVLNGNQDVEATYEITMKKAPTPFDGEVSATEMELGKDYQVTITEAVPAAWFTYTPQTDVSVIFESDECRYDTDGYIYDKKGSCLAEEDEDWEESYFRKQLDLQAGTQYYFEAKMYRGTNTGTFTVRLREKKSIASLEVIESDLKKTYLTSSVETTPYIYIRAVYTNGSSEQIRLGTNIVYAKDSSGNWIYRKILNENGAEVEDCSEPGTYTYWVRNGEITAKVGTFQVQTIKEFADQEVTDQDQILETAGTQSMRYHFTVEKTGIYQLNANVQFVNLALYNEAGNRIVSGLSDDAGKVYAALEKGTYYVKAVVGRDVSALKVSVKEVAFPKKVTAAVNGNELIAGLDDLNAACPSVKAEYADGTESWFFDNESDIYGNIFTFEASDQKGTEWDMFDDLPVGTYTIKPSVIRSYEVESDNERLGEELLNKALKEEDKTAVQVQVTLPELSTLQSIKENQSVTLYGTGRTLLAFTPDEDGTYTYHTEKGNIDSGDFCTMGAQRLNIIGDSFTAEKGKTYIFVAQHRADATVKIVKENAGGTAAAKQVQDFEICKKKASITADTEWEFVNSLYLRITYTDATSADIMIPEENEISVDEYGNTFKTRAVDSEYRGDDIWMTATVSCGTIQKTASMKVCSIEKQAEEIKISQPLTGSTADTVKFKAETSGTYLFRLKADAWGIDFSSYDTEQEFDELWSKGSDGAYMTQKTVYLQGGSCFYMTIDRENGAENNTYDLSVEKMDAVIADLEITETEDVYRGLLSYMNALKAKVTYTDGSSEIVDLNAPAKNGCVLYWEDSVLLSKDAARIVVRCGEHYAYKDVEVKKWESVKELTLSEGMAGSQTQKYTLCSFTPIQTGAYRVEVNGLEAEDTSMGDVRVVHLAEGRRVYSVYGCYDLQAGVTYGIAVYNEGKPGAPFTIVVQDAKSTTNHTHKYVSDTKEATCSEKGYTGLKCSGCGAEKAGSYRYFPATGHRSGTWTEAKAATCTENGNKAYWTCGSCKQTFADATAKQPVTAAQMVIPSRGGHDMKVVIDQKATCGTKGKEHRECSVCHIIDSWVESSPTGQHSFQYTVTKAPTVLKEGTETGICSVCKAKDIRSIRKLNGTIKLTVGTVKLQVKKSVELSKIVTGLSAGDTISKCVSSNQKTATVTNTGKVTGKKDGKATITIWLASGASAKVTVQVQKKAVATSSIKNVEKKWKAEIGEKKQLSPVISPFNTSDKLTYSSSNKKVATVSSKGVITAKKSGTAKITVKSGKKKVVMTVTVAKKAPTDMKLTPSDKTLKKGKSFTIKAKLLPAGSEAAVTYHTSNKKVATVNKKGKVTAKGAGTAVITVKAGKVTKTCKVTVK